VSGRRVQKKEQSDFKLVRCFYSSLQELSVAFVSFLPNFVVEWLTLLHHIRVFLGSDLGPEAGYFD
jgi:hypothetical protein